MPVSKLETQRMKLDKYPGIKLIQTSIDMSFENDKRSFQFNDTTSILLTLDDSSIFKTYGYHHL